MKEIIFMKFTKDLNIIAHRLGFKLTNYPENSKMAIEYIFNNKKILENINGFEFDICFTKDNVPIVTHDKYIDDISNKSGLIKNFNLEELLNMEFTFRKSLDNNMNETRYKILPLEDLLDFFENNYKLLKNKIIKFETKDLSLTKKNLKNLAQILNKYPKLFNNLIHLSYYPINLYILKKIQSNNKFHITKSDFLCENKIELIIPKFMKSIDYISLRIKTKNLPKLQIKNSFRVNKKIFLDRLFMKISDAFSEKILKFAIKKYGSVGVFTFNKEEIEEFCKKITDNFFKENYQKIVFTSDDPILIKKLHK